MKIERFVYTDVIMYCFTSSVEVILKRMRKISRLNIGDAQLIEEKYNSIVLDDDKVWFYFTNKEEELSFLLEYGSMLSESGTIKINCTYFT